MKVLLVAYAAATLLHHIHNAEYLGDYPNMPAWLSPAIVYAVWLGMSAVGAAGYLLLRAGWRLAGLAILAVYAAYGLDSLSHYALAPWSAHTAMMNLTIALEVVTAALLLLAVTRVALRARESPPLPRS